MADVYLKTTFQFRRGTYEEWETLNPVLRVGEPGFAYDLGILKIGDGISTWNELKSKDIAYVVDAPTVNGFPRPGNSTVLYKASDEKAIYQWNDSANDYECISSKIVSAENIDIDLIDGGNANG